MEGGLDAIVASSAHAARALVVTLAAADDAGIEVTVRDTGIGLPADDDVFVPFDSTKAGGLAHPDRGSTFRFTMPADRA